MWVIAGVIVIGATSRPDMLDAALLRPGRLDRLLYCGFPTARERLQVSLHYCDAIALASTRQACSLVEMLGALYTVINAALQRPGRLDRLSGLWLPHSPQATAGELAAFSCQCNSAHPVHPASQSFLKSA